MARLIVLNGPPGVGKSTIASRYLDDHPFALAIDIDSIRRLLGRWRDDPGRSGLVARAMTLTMARGHLTQGYDVVLPQYLGRTEFLEQAEQVAAETGADFHEFVLSDNRDEIVRRFNARTAAAAQPTHVDAGENVAALGGDNTILAMCDRLLLIIAARPGAQVVPCPEGAIEGVYAQIIERIESP